MSVAVQKPAPEFSATVVEGTEFKRRSLSDFAGQWLVLLFYPMDFTFVCPTELLAYASALPQFQRINTTVLGISTDSEYSHLAWMNLPKSEGGLGPNFTLPLLADRNMRMSREYGVLIEDKGIALRGLFIIDPAGIVRQSTVNDLPVGRSVDETIRLIKAFQFADEHGEVCPANWTEGSSTIKPDPQGSLEYFSKTNGTATNGHTNGYTNGIKKRPAIAKDEDDATKKARHI